MLNRHGLVAGATGTGKTKTLQLVAEQLSAAGVPAFLADIKGDLSGIAAPGVASERVRERAAQTGTPWEPRGCPVELLALGGLGPGVPVRATITSFGPVLLSKVLGLNRTQESSLGLVFHFADKAGLPLLDLKDLRSVISHLLSDEGKAALKALGGLSTATAGVILRELIGLEDAGGDVFFGEPEFDTADLLRTASDGRGLPLGDGSGAVQDKPKLFSTFLLWLLADLFQDLPEVGDVDKPSWSSSSTRRTCSSTTPSEAFLDAIARTVRLIRSKGVGVFFVTQTPDGRAGGGAGAARATGCSTRCAPSRPTTPRRSRRRSAPSRPATSTSWGAADVDGTGEAAVTILSERGAPTPVAWTLLRPPRLLMAPLDATAVGRLGGQSELLAEYGVAVDRESALRAAAGEGAARAGGRAGGADARPAGSCATSRERWPASSAQRLPELRPLGSERGRPGDQPFAVRTATPPPADAPAQVVALRPHLDGRCSSYGALGRRGR
jgi:hypothetical protein